MTWLYIYLFEICCFRSDLCRHIYIQSACINTDGHYITLSMQLSANFPQAFKWHPLTAQTSQTGHRSPRQCKVAHDMRRKFLQGRRCAALGAKKGNSQVTVSGSDQLCIFLCLHVGDDGTSTTTPQQPSCLMDGSIQTLSLCSNLCWISTV